MPIALPELERRYRLALEVFLELGGEDALQKAYAVGREVIAGGMGVLELSTIHGAILAELLARVPPKRAMAIVERSMNFLNESLSPFEMPLRGFRENTETIRRLAFIADASAVLAASLDCETTVRSVAQCAVPFLADWSLVYLVDADGSTRCGAVAQVEPSKSELARQLENHKFPIVPSWVSRAFLIGKPEVISDKTTNWLEVAGSTDAAPVVHAAMVVPLIARERALGVLVLLSLESERPFNSPDQALADDLGRRCAIAIDNSRQLGEAEKTIQAKDKSLSLLRHELRNPLVPILGWVRILKTQSPIMSNDNLAEGVASLERNARVMQQLLDANSVGGSIVTPETPPVKTPIRVLLLEDSKDVLRMMKNELEWAGFTVFTATDGRAGLELAKRERPDVIVSDIRMPGMDGYQFLKELRRMPSLGSIPAIALTGFGSIHDIEEARKAGYAEHMVKPVDPSHLATTIVELTRHRS